MRLLLLRHAKSDWSDAALRDEDRPLAARGIRAAKKIAGHMRRKGYVPTSILCSSARRTRETLDVLLSEWDARPKVQYEDALYLSEWPVLLKHVRAASDALSPLLVIGHNPGLQELAIQLARKPVSGGERTRGERLKEKFPTAALAVFDIEAKRWQDVATGSGQLTDYVRPRDIGGAGRDD